MLEHIVVMEKKIGRMLTMQERVHHINHIRGDNRPENLMLIASNGEHTRLHALEQSKERKKPTYGFKCVRCNSENIYRFGKGLRKVQTWRCKDCHRIFEKQTIEDNPRPVTKAYSFLRKRSCYGCGKQWSRKARFLWNRGTALGLCRSCAEKTFHE